MLSRVKWASQLIQCLFSLSFAIMPSVPRDKDYPVCFPNSNCKFVWGVGRGRWKHRKPGAPTPETCLTQTQSKSSLRPLAGPVDLYRGEEHRWESSVSSVFKLFKKVVWALNSHGDMCYLICTFPSQRRKLVAPLQFARFTTSLHIFSGLYKKINVITLAHHCISFSVDLRQKKICSAVFNFFSNSYSCFSKIQYVCKMIKILSSPA